MKKDNPASRLYLLMKASVSVSSNGNHPQRHVWKSILNMKDASDSQLNMQIGKVMGLPEEIQIWLKENFPNKNWTHWKDAFDDAFSQLHLSGKWAGVANCINERAMTELDIISTLYETKGSIDLIEQQDMDSFKEKLVELKTEIITSLDLPEGMKKKFLRYLNHIIEAIESYQITGVEPVMEAIESAFGHVVIDKEYGVALRDTDLGAKLLQCMASIVDAVAESQGLPGIATSLLEMFNPIDKM